MQPYPGVGAGTNESGYRVFDIVIFWPLTYMSIRDEINYWVARGVLFQVFPTMRGPPIKRVLVASEEVNRLITGPWNDEKEELRSGRLWADFDRFVEGRLISLSLDNPYSKPKSTYAARLDPVREDVWEIRSRDPKPGIRVFGRFAEVDVFVALTWGYRENLGGPNSKEFDLERERCKSEWKKLFYAYPAIFGSKVDEYVSENAFLV